MKYAILAGIEEYESGSGISNLRFACRDVYSIGRALQEKCGFDEVRVLADKEDCEFGLQRAANPTDSGILQSIDHAAAKLREEDLFFFLFAGHGIEQRYGESLRSYLLAQNAHLRFRKGMIEVGELRQMLSKLDCRYRTIFLDCCRNGVQRALGDGDNPMGQLLARDIVAASQRGEGHEGATVLMTACSPGHRAWEWDEERHGVFSYFLLNGLEGAAWRGSQLEAQALCGYVEREVKAWSRKTGRPQAPYFEQLESAQPIVLGTKCPVCGQSGDPAETFECKECKRNHLCNAHFVKERRCCEDCASKLAQAEKERAEAEALHKKDMAVCQDQREAEDDEVPCRQEGAGAAPDGRHKPELLRVTQPPESPPQSPMRRGSLRAIYSLCTVLLAGVVGLLIYNVPKVLEGDYDKLVGLPLPVALIGAATITPILFTRNWRFRTAALVSEYFCLIVFGFCGVFSLQLVLTHHSWLTGERAQGILCLALITCIFSAIHTALIVFIRKDSRATGP